MERQTGRHRERDIQTDGQAGRRADGKTFWETAKGRNRHIQRWKYRKADRQTSKQLNRQTDEQAEEE